MVLRQFFFFIILIVFTGLGSSEMLISSNVNDSVVDKNLSSVEISKPDEATNLSGAEVDHQVYYGFRLSNVDEQIELHIERNNAVLDENNILASDLRFYREDLLLSKKIEVFDEKIKVYPESSGTYYIVAVRENVRNSNLYRGEEGNCQFLITSDHNLEPVETCEETDIIPYNLEYDISEEKIIALITTVIVIVIIILSKKLYRKLKLRKIDKRIEHITSEINQQSTTKKEILTQLIEIDQNAINGKLKEADSKLDYLEQDIDKQ